MRRTGNTLSLREALEVFEENIPEIKTAVMDNMKHEIQELRRPNAKEPNLFWVQKEVFFLKVQEIKNRFMPTLRLIALRNQPKKEGMITDTDIQRAKEYPIEELLDTKGKKGNVSCPFHEDKNPSLQIKKNNTWTCYSCGEFGDSIDIYMKLHNTDFLTAVKQLV